MKALKLKDSQLEQIFFGDSKRFTVVDEGEWEQDGKYQNCEFRFKDTTTNLMYKGCIERCGSPFSDWNYMSDIGCDDTYIYNPVEEVEVITTVFTEMPEDKITETETVDEL